MAKIQVVIECDGAGSCTYTSDVFDLLYGIDDGTIAGHVEITLLEGDD